MRIDARRFRQHKENRTTFSFKYPECPLNEKCMHVTCEFAISKQCEHYDIKSGVCKYKGGNGNGRASH